jgi:hypothetical protein
MEVADSEVSCKSAVLTEPLVIEVADTLVTVRSAENEPRTADSVAVLSDALVILPVTAMEEAVSAVTDKLLVDREPLTTELTDTPPAVSEVAVKSSVLTEPADRLVAVNRLVLMPADVIPLTTCKTHLG